MAKADSLITDHIDIWTSAIKKCSSQGRGSNKKIELTGIKKLRELILELAVRGQLVPQDPNDEPAAVLLEKIAAEKAQLIKDKRIKKAKVLPEISEGEKPFGLPDGWAWIRLGDLTNYGNSDKVEAKDTAPDTWILELEDVEKSTSKLLGKIRFSNRQFKSSKNKFSNGDVIYGKLRPYLDKVLVADEDGVCTTEMIPLRAYSSVDSYFLRLLMKSPYFINYANNSTHGMSLPRMGTDKALLAILPLAPELEQHRIVAKVDELMALCDQLEQQTEDSITAHKTLVESLLATLTSSENSEAFNQSWTRIAEHFDTLFTTEHSIDQLKQTVLQLAVMGKLVPQDPNDEPAPVLLKKIAAEKEQLIKDKKIKKQKVLPAISEDEKPFGLPNGWEWIRLQEISLYIQRGKGPKYEDFGQVRVVSQKCIQWAGFNIKPARYVADDSLEKYQKERYLQSKDLLWNSTGTGTVGRVNILENIKGNTLVADSHVTVIRTLLVNSLFIKSYIAAPGIQQRIDPSNENSLVSGSTKQVELNTSVVMNLEIPIPPLAEQHRIVKKVDELLSLCDQLKARLSQAQTTQLQLADTLVKQAVN